METPHHIYRAYHALPEDSKHRANLERVAVKARWDLSKSTETVKKPKATSTKVADEIVWIKCPHRGETVPYAEFKDLRDIFAKHGRYYSSNCSGEVKRCDHHEHGPIGFPNKCRACPVTLAKIQAKVLAKSPTEQTWDEFNSLMEIKKQEWIRNPLPTGEGEGIVICGGGKYFCSAYVNFRLLRRMGCKLPIEVWYLGGREEFRETWKKECEKHDVVAVDAEVVRKTHPMRNLNGWELKPYAVAYSKFKRVLSLDADCYAMQEPSFVLNDPRFLGAGALFFRDNAKGVGILTPEVWGFFGMPKKNVWAHESGVFAIDKSRWRLALGMAVTLNDYSDRVYSVVYGDKDTYQLAAGLTEATFAIPPFLPAGGDWGLWQKWFNGANMFQHRIHCKFVLNPESFPSYQRRIGRTLPHYDEMEYYANELRSMS